MAQRVAKANLRVLTSISSYFWRLSPELKLSIVVSIWMSVDVVSSWVILRETERQDNGRSEHVSDEGS